MKKTFTKTYNIQDNNNGFSLVELIVVMAIVAIMSLGTTALVNNLMKLSAKSNTKANLSTIRDQLLKTLKDEASWTQTVTRNPALTCLLESNNTKCTNNALVTNFVVYNRQGVVFYDPSQASNGFSSLAANRFNVSGGNCDGFSAAGDDDCPYRYDIRLRFECKYGAAECKSPDVRIQGDFKYSPSTDKHIANTLELIDTAGGEVGWEARGKMDFELQKSSVDKIDSFQVMFATTNAAGGNCSTGAWRKRELNYTNFNTSQTLISLDRTRDTLRMQLGFYTCEIKAEAYGATRGFAIRLRNLTAPASIPVSSGYSGPDSSTTAIGSFDLEVTNTAHEYQIQHFCTQDNPLHNFDMGIPKEDYGVDPDGIGINRYTVMTCTKKG